MTSKEKFNKILDSKIEKGILLYSVSNASRQFVFFDKKKGKLDVKIPEGISEEDFYAELVRMEMAPVVKDEELF